MMKNRSSLGSGSLGAPALGDEHAPHSAPYLHLPSARHRIGRTLRHRYHLESLLGIGSMGEVYLCTDRRSGRRCAAKLILPGDDRTLQVDRRFVREFHVASRLFHPNVMEVYDFDEDEDGTKFMIMELLVGNDLQRLLRKRQRLPLSSVLSIVRRVGAALQYAHDLDIIHRDVKPANIFIVSSPSPGGEQIKVLDFGLAKFLHASGALRWELLTKGIAVGTPQYLSPEGTTLSGETIDARTDQWALAVVAYQLLSGRYPFEDPDPYALCRKICADEPTPLRALVPDLPPHIYQSISTALSKRKDDRFAQIADFVRSFGGGPALNRSRCIPAREGQLQQSPALPPVAHSSEIARTAPDPESSPASALARSGRRPLRTLTSRRAADRFSARGLATRLLRWLRLLFLERRSRATDPAD